MSDLGLEEQAGRCFQYLIDEHGYHCVSAGPYLVEYRSAAVRVKVVFDGPRTDELDVYIGRIGVDDIAFSLTEVLRTYGVADAASFASVVVKSREAMTTHVARMANALRTYGGDLVAGSDAAFTLVEEQLRRDAARYAEERAR